MGLGMLKLGKIFISLLALLSAVAAFGAWWLNGQFHAPSAQNEDRIVIIEKGQGFSAIAHQLQVQGVIEDARLFMIPVLLRGEHRRVQAGEYAFAGHSSPAKVIEKLRSGDVVVHQLTLIEGWSNRQIAAALMAEDALFGDMPKELLDDTMQGQFLPDTVQFTRGLTRAQIIKERQAAMKKLLEELWQNRAQDLPFHTRHEALVLASIIERETAVDEERRLVASVYVNRMRMGMRLQADPTVQYGIEQARGAPLDGTLTSKDIQTDSAFNTYTRDGLPPTPICNPGRASIEAALHPATTDALYFVADGKGGHVFAKTLGEHNANVMAYRLALKEK